MKFIKISLVILLVGSLSSCLKAKTDWGGVRTDQGGVLTSIMEKQYTNTDAENIGFGWSVFANFAFNQIPNEAVRFFTLHISQPRSTKMSGPMTVKFTMTSISGYTPLPAGAVTVTDLVIPASSALAFDVPVTFVVNKTLLNAANAYAATFTITDVSQGQFSELDKSVDVYFNDDPLWNNSRYGGRYQATTTITDANNVYGIENNTRPFVIQEGKWNPFWYYGPTIGSSPNPYFGLGAPSYTANNLYVNDIQQYGFSSSANYRSLYANNITTGANTAIVQPVYVVNASGTVIDVKSYSTGLTLSPTFDASHPNSFVYTDNGNRVLDVKYSVSLTLNAITRVFTITDVYKYDATQAFY